MELNLTKPLIVFDLETTGLDVVNDRITQISYIKVMPDGKESRGNYLVNPGVHIPAEVSQLTGITDEVVADKPTFKELAPELGNEFRGCDFCGYNSNHFDIPMLDEEFYRAGVEFDFTKCRLIDAQAIFMKQERRNLSAAYKFYTGRRMEDDFRAHRADQDTQATYEVLKGELERYSPENLNDPDRTVLHNDMSELAEFSKHNDNVDFAGRIIWKDVVDVNGKPVMGKDGKPKRQEVFNFGKHKGEAVVDVIHNEPGFIGWMLNSDFAHNTKLVLERIQMRDKMKNFNNGNVSFRK